MQDMLATVGWIVVAWVLLTLPLGICIGAVLRDSAVGRRRGGADDVLTGPNARF